MHHQSQEQQPMSHVTTDRLVEDLKRVVHDAEALLKATAGQAGENIQQARAMAESSLHAARSRLAELGGDAAARVRDTAERTNSYVHGNPWVAVGVGAVAGLLVGLLVGRNRNGRS
jgi:ElaB/YqjD/DUF883 family membrane-anchored ribosome-binding protein